MLKCPSCDHRYNTEPKLIEHRTSVHSAKRHNCTLILDGIPCSFETLERQKFRDHQNRVHSRQAKALKRKPVWEDDHMGSVVCPYLPCSERGDRYAKGPRTREHRLQQHFSEFTLECKVCDTLFNTIKALGKHLSSDCKWSELLRQKNYRQYWRRWRDFDPNAAMNKRRMKVSRNIQLQVINWLCIPT